MQAILAVTVPFFALVLAGWLAARSRVLPESAIPGLNAFVLYFALPCMLLRFGMTTPVLELLNPAVLGVYLVAAALLVAFTVALTWGPAPRGVGLRDAAFGALVAAFPNTGFMGLPLLVALLGPAAAGPVICTILADLFFTSSLCIALAQAQGARGARAALAAALRSAKLEVQVVDERSLPGTLGELQANDAILLSNVSAGDLGQAGMRLLESAVRDFGIGLICVGGYQTYAAGGYRRTPLEAALPLDMELNSKKVLPKGALGLVMHGMEFANGNQVAREIALAALDALGPQDEMGVWLWDGTERPLFPLQAVGSKTDLARQIAGMNQGDLPSFDGLMRMALDDLTKSTANLKHLIVFSDGDPGAPGASLMQEYVTARITISTVMIGGHVQPTTMERMAAEGGGRFYDVKSAAVLPQIFIKEAAVILKSAISEDPFKPQVAASSELTRGIGGDEYPILRGYVAATGKPRAEVPLLTDKGDPLLAHWQYGLGRAVAFTSDARPKWAQDWMGWGRYQ